MVAALIILMFTGACLALLLCNASNVIREDGTKVILMKNPSWGTELKGLWDTLTQNLWIILLFPLFWSSNFFYTYQFNGFNSAGFNLRTRSLNNVLYWLSQIIGAWLFGYALDFKGIRRSIRAKICYSTLCVLTFVIWGGGYTWQKLQPSRSETSSKEYDRHADWTDGGKRFIGPMFLFMFYGFYDAAWQTAIYWWMGAMSNSGRKAANMTGFYKGIQSAGAAVAWRLDGMKTDYMTLFGATVSYSRIPLLSSFGRLSIRNNNANRSLDHFCLIISYNIVGNPCWIIAFCCTCHLAQGQGYYRSRRRLKRNRRDC